VNDLLDISQPGKRHTLMLALLRQARMRGRDELIEMMLRRIRRTQAAAKEDGPCREGEGSRGVPLLSRAVRQCPLRNGLHFLPRSMMSVDRVFGATCGFQ
jgi:hypothetical protein